MDIGSKIAQYRKKKGLTQEALAQRLNVTNQAVSKWESDQSCPDIQTLPLLADIFGISLDDLFGRETHTTPTLIHGLPWADDENLRVVLYHGHKLLKHSDQAGEFVFRYEGPVTDLICDVNVVCGAVGGNVDAGQGVNCGDVGGDVDAGQGVNCGDVDGNVDAGGSVQCGNVGGNVDAGTTVACVDVGGDVDAGVDVACCDVGGDVDAGVSVACCQVHGSINAETVNILQNN